MMARLMGSRLCFVLSAVAGTTFFALPALAGDDDKAKDAHVHVPFLDLDVGSNGVKINAPFVKLDKRLGNPNVKINVPFVNIDDRQGDAQVHVNAPLVNVNKDRNNPNVRVNAPLVNVNSTTPGARVNAPFVKVDPQDGDGVNVQAPLVNVNKPRKDAPVRIDAPGVDLNVKSDDPIDKHAVKGKDD